MYKEKLQKPYLAGRIDSTPRRDFLATLAAGAALSSLPGSARARDAGAVSYPPVGAGLLSWQDYVELLKPAGDLISLTWEPRSEQLRAELYRQLVMNISQAYFLYFESDPDYPDWAPFENSVFTLQPNPDDTYFYAPVRGTGVYRVVGERGSVHLLLFSTGADIIGMTDKMGPGFGDYDAAQIEVDANGNFEVIFSTERPKGHSGNWWYLDPKANFIIVRAVSYDWGKERDPRLAIERMDVVPLKPRQSAQDIDASLRALLGGYTRRMSKLWLDYTNRMRDRGNVNKMELTKFADMGTGKSWPQYYWQSVYEVGPDEALILETELPKTRPYWNVQVADELWNQVEFINRQGSLNGHQARVDSDGKFRAVISLNDPGVPNWLDIAGYLQGSIIGRWYRCDSNPLPTLTRVSFADVRNHIPLDTPHVSLKERVTAISKRRIGAQLRRRW